MKRRSLAARAWAIAMAAALVFAQLTLAAYACPLAAATSTPMASKAAIAEEGCPQADPGSPQLCAKSCQGEAQKPEAASLDALPPFLDGGIRLLVPVPLLVQGAVHAVVSLAHATAPPASILFSRFLK